MAVNVIKKEKQTINVAFFPPSSLPSSILFSLFPSFFPPTSFLLSPFLLPRPFLLSLLSCSFPPPSFLHPFSRRVKCNFGEGGVEGGHQCGRKYEKKNKFKTSKKPTGKYGSPFPPFVGKKRSSKSIMRF